jgi:hypothetical protein
LAKLDATPSVAVDVRGGAFIARRSRLQLGGLLGAAGGDHVLEEHVVVGREADAGAQQIVDAGALLEERVDDGRTLRHLRRLAQVRQHRQHRAQRPVVGDGAAVVDARHRDAAAQLGDQRQVQNQWRRQQRVLARVVHHDRVVATEHDLGRVLVHRALAVACKHGQRVIFVYKKNHVFCVMVKGFFL